MPRAEGLKTYTTFVKGLITEAGPLTFPKNASLDESNCVLSRKGNRYRRLGVDYEPFYSMSTSAITDIQASTNFISTHVWSSVAGDGNRNFLAVQIGADITFYDLAVSPISSAKKSFSVSLLVYGASGVVDVEKERVSMDSGKGYLFIVGGKIEPIYISYDPATDSISITQITVEVRDFEGVEDGLSTTDEPATLSDLHSYNLKNQGWNSPGSGVADPTTTYFTDKAVYPPNNKQWWVGKDTSDNFSSAILAKYGQGNMEAPKGHFLLNAFYKDRANVSGVASIPVESETSRPRSVSFFAGRVFYAGVNSSKINGHIYYSQVIEKDNNIGRCYQAGDPTSENTPDLVDTDGGFIVIPEVGTVERLFVMKKGLLIFANNGTWIVTGPDNGFKATSFVVNKISSVGIIGPETIVDVEGVPYWWAEQGIYKIASDKINQKFFAHSVTELTISSKYLSIDGLSKVYCKGVYDPSLKIIKWFYSGAQPDINNKHQYEEVLNFDTTLEAFYPWTVSDLAVDTPHIASVFKIPSITSLSESYTIIDSSGNLVVDSSLNDVVSLGNTIQGGVTQLGVLTLASVASNDNRYTFAQFSKTSFLDWESVDTVGVGFSSFLETGYELASDISRFKQAKYLIVYFNRTENLWVSDGAGGFKLDSQSACIGRAKWDWADVGRGKWSSTFNAYRIMPTPIPPSASVSFENGKPVVITRNKIRGKGRALSIRFESEAGKDFDLLGWVADITGNTKL